MIHLQNPDEVALRLALADLLSGVRNRSRLATKLGVHRTTLYKWENGEARPTLPMLSRLCCALDTPLRIDLGPDIVEDEAIEILRRIETRLGHS